MQFVWQSVNDMVGKGIGMGVLAQLFFYAALTLVPMSMPLAVLLASLMTFGNLGEHLELLAMKASGISLLRIMKPLIIAVIGLVGISFYFQNNILPQAYVKMYTILDSVRDKSPELSIPVGVFYKEIPGYNVYVRHKDPKTGSLLDMMIYDFSKGFENAAVIVADTGKLAMSDDKMHLVLTLYSGESFENLGTRKTRWVAESVPYRRETFSLKQILIPFDSNFTMNDESARSNRDMGKNINQLTHFADSVSHQVDSLALQALPIWRERIYLSSFKQRSWANAKNAQPADSLYEQGFQAVFDNLNEEEQLRYVNRAKDKVENFTNQYSYDASVQLSSVKQIRAHQIQLQKKFTFSLACLLFFFIGAPLGAIIRKGGIGLPAVLSVFLFLFYYTIDILGIKLARQGVLPIWEGMWLSSLPLAILGVFFTYKAVNDSVMMNPDAWKSIWQRIMGKREVRNYAKKEIIMNPADYPKDLAFIEEFNRSALVYLQQHAQLPFYIAFWQNAWRNDDLQQLVFSMESYIEDLKNADENLIIAKLIDYPVITPMHLPFLKSPAVRTILAVLFPVGLLIYGRALWKRKQINNDLQTTLKVNEEIETELKKYDPSTK
jgi:lipopolysaccharide export system permease protein